MDDNELEVFEKSSLQLIMKVKRSKSALKNRAQAGAPHMALKNLDQAPAMTLMVAW